MENKIWLIAYINRSFIKNVEIELKQYGYTDIEAYIPTINILKKQFKGKQLYEVVPLLFNYGFFKVPLKDAQNPEYLMTLRHRITCIYGWVKDPCRTMRSSPRLRTDNDNFSNSLPKVAIASDKEIANLIKSSKEMGTYSSEDISRLKKGDYIKLEGYPFDGIPAEIVEIKSKKKEVIVKLLIESVVREVTVSFDNIFYTIYKDYDETPHNRSIDSMSQGLVDSITFKNLKYEK